jgi:lipopolysaccharide cholinephosphotransferase
MRLKFENDYDIGELQRKITGNLVELDRVCREHGLTYYLWAGTMLGAVRHKGFIPWDDDIDVAMPRPDYERLMAHWKEWMAAPYEVIAPESDGRYPYPFAKVEDVTTTVMERPDFDYMEGVYVDIFPLDGFPADKGEQQRHYRRWKLWRHLLFMRCRDPYKHGHGPRSWFPWLIHRVFSLSWLQRKVRKLMTRYDFEQAECIIAYDDNGIDALFPKHLFGETKMYDFEGGQYPGLARADEYLTINFGSDYMQLPPVEKRVQHHFYRLDLNVPYREATIS